MFYDGALLLMGSPQTDSSILELVSMKANPFTSPFARIFLRILRSRALVIKKTNCADLCAYCFIVSCQYQKLWPDHITIIIVPNSPLSLSIPISAQSTIQIEPWISFCGCFNAALDRFLPWINRIILGNHSNNSSRCTSLYLHSPSSFSGSTL